MKVLFVLFLAIASACAFGLRSEEEVIDTTRYMPVINPEGRITNGAAVDIENYNYQVGLSVNGGWCGGSLIKTTYVLTAAHCVKGLAVGKVIAYLGSATRLAGTSRVARAIIVHEGYNANTLVNDVALVKIDAVSLSSQIGLVNLPSSTASSYAGSVGIASGWGKTTDTSSVATKLQAAKLPVIANANCAAVYGSIIVSSTLCVETPKGTSTCQGDSGGPLVLEGTRTLMGVTSFVASAGCTAGYPSGFSRVSSYVTWIANNSMA